MPSYAVVGASRGIGLELVRQLAAKQSTVVFAIARNTGAPHLQRVAANHKNVHIVQGDIVDHHSIQSAAERVAELSGGGLDVLIHNAALMTSATIHRSFSDYTNLDELDADFNEAFKVNTLGAIHSAAAFLPLLRRGTLKRLVFISSGAADPALAVKLGIPDMVAYSTTKAATAMAAAKYAAALKSEGFTVVSMRPGVVDTSATADPKEAEAARKVLEDQAAHGFRPQLLTPEESVAGQLKVLEGLTSEHNGATVSYNGEITL
ncbi:NAD-P-binding protein [Trametes elegans]|nr:NAD-P-binding protein [Trametes elegans]